MPVGVNVFPEGVQPLLLIKNWAWILGNASDRSIIAPLRHCANNGCSANSLSPFRPTIELWHCPHNNNSGRPVPVNYIKSTVHKRCPWSELKVSCRGRIANNSTKNKGDLNPADPQDKLMCLFVHQKTYWINYGPLAILLMRYSTLIGI